MGTQAAGQWAIAAGSGLAAEAGNEVLGAGGNAVDAAVAAALAACVAEPVLASLLGGGILMVREADGRARVLDAFVQTPRRRKTAGDTDLREIVADFGDTTQAFHIGAGTIATPGLGPGLWEAHARLGRMPLADLAAPACAAARTGTPIEAFQATVLGIVLPIYRASPAAAALFLGGEDAAPAAGTPIVNPALADVIETAVAEGVRFLSEGEPAAALVALCDTGGHLGRDDLQRYEPQWRTPLTAQRGAVALHFNPAPALGGLAAELLLAELPPKASAVDLAATLAMLDRARHDAAEAADPPGTLADPARRAAWAMARQHAQAPRGTTHISVVDGDGMAAALSLSNGEGCGLVVPGTGMMPNNMLGEADLVPEPGHFPLDKRLSTMMAPSMAAWPDGRLAALGSGGSTRIPGAVGQVLAHLIDRNRALSEAIAAPRLHVHGGDLDAEDRLPEAERAALLEAWPEARLWAEDSMYFGGVHGVLREPRGAAHAAGDHRRAGATRTG